MAQATKKQALGRGLSALLRDPDNDIRTASDKNADKVIGNIVEIALDAIELNPFQPRTHFNEENLQELASSIKELGVIQPITVRKIDFGKFQLVSGERRYRASKVAGLPTIPAYVRIANDQESLEMALVENIQREDLDPIEIALSYRRLIEEIQLTQERLSARVGKKRSTIANYLRLLKLDPIIQTGMRDGFVSMGHGRALLTVEDRKMQLEVYEKIIARSLSVRATEALVKKHQNNRIDSLQTKNAASPSYLTESVSALTTCLSAPVAIQLGKKGAGKLIISFQSKEELLRLKNLLTQ
jgi:ParB family chromosome partitioning protein